MPVPRARVLSYTFISLLLLVSNATAKSKKAKAADPQDEIAVVAHLPLSAGPVRRFLTTQHYSSHYLYAEGDPGKAITLIDVTKASSPAVLAEVASAPDGSLLAVAGTAALIAEGPAANASSVPQTLRIMDLSDPQHPRVGREFIGITALGRDARRGVVYIANAEGIWILKQRLAEDPSVEEEYAHRVVYAH